MKRKMEVLFVLLMVFTLLAACGKKQDVPAGSVSLPSQIDKLTISWNGGPRTTFSYTDPAKIKSITEYLSSLVLEATEKDPTIYDGGGWVITVLSGDETFEMKHYGNAFFKTTDGIWWELSYDQAAEFEDLLKHTLPDDMPEFIPKNNPVFDEWKGME